MNKLNQAALVSIRMCPSKTLHLTPVTATINLLYHYLTIINWIKFKFRVLINNQKLTERSESEDIAARIFEISAASVESMPKT